jgi:hypothetical protein
VYYNSNKLKKNCVLESKFLLQVREVSDEIATVNNHVLGGDIIINFAQQRRESRKRRFEQDRNRTGL